MNNDRINEYYVRKFRETARERAQRIGALKNREDALRAVDEARASQMLADANGNIRQTIESYRKRNTGK